MRGHPGGSHLPETVELGKVLHAVISASEKEFGKLANQKTTFRSTKLNMMTTLYKLRIRLARFLVLYQWNKTHQSQSLLGNHAIPWNHISKATKKLLFSVEKAFLFPKGLPVTTQFGSLSECDRVKVRYSPRELAAQIMSDCVSSRISAHYSMGILDIRGDEFELSIKLSSSGKRRLRRFSVVWPKGLKTNLSPKFVAYLSHIVEESRHLVRDAEYILHRMYLHGLFLLTYQQLLDIQSPNSFVASRVENVIMLTFPRSFAPSNEFVVEITDSGVKLLSNTPVLRPHQGVMTYCPSDTIENVLNHLPEIISFSITGDENNIHSVIDAVRRYAFYTRLYRLWRLIVYGVSTITMKAFHATFEETSISIYLFDECLCSIELNPANGDPVVNTFGGLGASPGEFLEAIQGCECQRNDVMRAIFTHAFAKLIFESVCGNHSPFHYKYYHDSVNNSTKALNFSFAPDFVLLFSELEGKPRMAIHSKSTRMKMINKEIILLQETSGDDILDNIRNAARHAKASILMLQFRETLARKNLHGAIEQSKIHFFVEPFECIEFEVDETSSWTLTFIKPDVTVFEGTSIGSRFVDWILHMVDAFAALTRVRRQVSGACIMNSSISHVDAHDGRGFRIIPKPDFATFINVEWTNTHLLYSTVHGGHTAYSVDTSRTPYIEFCFGKNMEMKWHIRSLLRTHVIGHVFGAFLNGSFIALMKFHSVFMEGKNSDRWSVSNLCDEQSFFLVYKGEYSMNCTMRSLEIFQLIIPSIGKSSLLQIPVKMMPEFQQGATHSHAIVKLTMDQLEFFRDTVEDLFDGMLDDFVIDPTNSVGIESSGNDVICYHPNTPPWASIIVRLKGKTIEFTVQGNREISPGIERFLRFNFGSLKIQSRAAVFIYQLLELEQPFVAFVVQMLLRIISPTFVNRFAVDWQNTILSVDKDEHTIDINIASLAGSNFSMKMNDALQIVVINTYGATVMESVREFDNWLNE